MVPLLLIVALYLVDPVPRRNPVLLEYRVDNNEEFVGDDGLHEERPNPGEGEGLQLISPLPSLCAIVRTNSPHFI